MRTIVTSLLLAAATGISTNQVRTAAPSAVNLSSVAAAEGSSLAMCRADHTHSLSGTLPESLGGTGAGAITCPAGQFLTSNGTAYSCTDATVSSPLTVTSHTIGCQDATGSVGGCINTTTQTVAGNKTLAGTLSIGPQTLGGTAWALDVRRSDMAGMAVARFNGPESTEKATYIFGGGNPGFGINTYYRSDLSAWYVEKTAWIGALDFNPGNGVWRIRSSVSSQTAGSSFADGSFTHGALSGGGALIQQDGWTNISLVNSYTALRTASYFKDSLGVVHLRGTVSGGSVALIGTLASGYWPSQDWYFATDHNSAYGRIHIDPNGNVSSDVGGFTNVVLDGITFATF